MTGPSEVGIRVVVADDHPVVREGLTTILAALDGVTVAGVATDGEEALALAGHGGVDVVLLDLQMPGMGGAEAIRQLALQSPEVAVVVLTTYTDDESIIQALAAGACGYLTKSASSSDIGRALRAAMTGHAVMDRSVQQRLIELAAPTRAGDLRELPDGLSHREGEVLGLIALGLSNVEIAEQLFVSRATVKSHVNQILRKTGCRDRPQAIVYALSHNVPSPPADQPAAHDRTPAPPARP